MAIMLAFYTTDAAVSPVLLEKALKTVVPGTYNQMSVDLDTSTNDTLIIMLPALPGIRRSARKTRITMPLWRP